MVPWSASLYSRRLCARESMSPSVPQPLGGNAAVAGTGMRLVYSVVSLTVEEEEDTMLELLYSAVATDMMLLREGGLKYLNRCLRAVILQA